MVPNASSSAESQITFANAGLYNIQFSAQVMRSQVGTANNMTIWLRVNGLYIPWRATDFTWLLATGPQLDPIRPAIPSIILTVNQVR